MSNPRLRFQSKALSHMLYLSCSQTFLKKSFTSLPKTAMDSKNSTAKILKTDKSLPPPKSIWTPLNGSRQRLNTLDQIIKYQKRRNIKEHQNIRKQLQRSYKFTQLESDKGEQHKSIAQMKFKEEPPKMDRIKLQERIQSQLQINYQTYTKQNEPKIQHLREQIQVNEKDLL
ncbi:hypothetical protein pb186bvf_001700 [Paramecium bursaria]